MSQKANLFKPPRDPLGHLSASIVFLATLLLLSACGQPQEQGYAVEKVAVVPDESYPAVKPEADTNVVSGPKANIAEAQKTMDENPGLDWNRASNLTIERKLGWDRLPDGKPSTDLPCDLDGVTLYGDDGSEIKLLASGKATLQTPQDATPVDATFAVSAPHGATLTYTDNGKACKVAFAAQRIGRKIQLNVQSSTLPKLPSVLKGTLKK